MTENLPESFGARIRRLRIAREMSQQALASEAGLSVTYLSRLERDEGGRQPHPITLAKLARVFGIAVAELFPEATEVGA